MRGPLFSVLTVTLNPGKGDLLATVNSVREQNCSDWELIVKDGGSTDGSLEAIPADDRIRVHRQSDSGIFDAMNQVAGTATGEFICFLNAGDTLFRPQTLSTVATAREQHPGTDFFYGNVRKLESRAGYDVYPKRLSRYFVFTRMVCHQAWFLRRSYFTQTGGYETKHVTGGDYRFFVRMLCGDRVPYAHVNSVVAVYKGGGVSQRKEHLNACADWIAEARRSAFSERERALYGAAWRMRNGLKTILYDRFLWPIWGMIRRRRARRESE